MLLSKIIKDLQHIQRTEGDLEIEEITSDENFDQVVYNQDTKKLDFYFMPF